MRDCTCCGAPAHGEPEPVVTEDDCDCGCDDCDECEWCFHECECGDCEDCGYSDEEPVVLCHGCKPDGEECDNSSSWHCTCPDRTCDGSGCPAERLSARRQQEFEDTLRANGVTDAHL